MRIVACPSAWITRNLNALSRDRLTIGELTSRTDSLHRPSDMSQSNMQLNQKYCRDPRAACCAIEMWRVAKSGHGRIQSAQRVQLATRQKTQFHPFEGRKSTFSQTTEKLEKQKLRLLRTQHSRFCHSFPL
jgi:uncharacterized protein YceH (UPF0502 family)